MQQRIVVVGAGFAGVWSALAAMRPHWFSTLGTGPQTLR
jgi:NADH dehydrogenase FAD-containing subunit